MTLDSDPHDKIYNLIGKATVAWNGIEHGWMLVFQTLISAPQDKAKAAFFAITNSTSQRKMIAALAALIFKDDNTQRCEILNLLNKTGKKSGWRNAFSHGFYGVDVYQDEKGEYIISPLKIINGSANNRLHDKDLETELLKLIQEFNTMAREVFDLWRRIGGGQSSPEPSSDKRPAQ